MTPREQAVAASSPPLGRFLAGCLGAAVVLVVPWWGLDWWQHRRDFTL